MVAACSARPKPVSLPIAVANVALPRTFRVVPDTRLLDRGRHDARSRILPHRRLCLPQSSLEERAPEHDELRPVNNRYHL